MAAITTRAGKGSPLTNAELDANFNNINTGITTAAAITGGTINGTTIGATVPTTGVFSELDVDNLELNGNAIISTNVNGNIDLTPNGTGAVNITKLNVTGIATLAAGAVLGTPASGTVTNLTGTASININGTVGATTANTGAFTTLTATADSSFAAPVVIEGTTTSAALRITQLGTGNALLVEDSANPDSTPTVITKDGDVIIGGTAAIPSYQYFSPQLNVMGGSVGAQKGGQYTIVFSNDANGASVELGKSRSTTIGTVGTIVQSGDELGIISFNGDDGTDLRTPGATIRAFVDGTPGTNDMPGRLVFSTTADGASSPTTRLTIYSDGSIQAGTSQAPSYNLRVGRNISGAASGGNFYASGTVQSDVTSNGYGFLSEIKTAAASFVLNSAHGFRASQGTIGAGSSITNQYGFNADSTLVGATNNYGFYGNIASGTGRYNLYMNGTADNYMAGKTRVGTAAAPTVSFEVGATDAMLLPKGTSAQQPTGVAGYLRFNTDTTQFEGYNGTAWSSVGGAAIVNDTSTTSNLYPLFAGATSGTALTIYTGNAFLLYKPSTGELQSRVPVASNGIVVNSLTVATSYTIAAGFSGASAGPITIASGQSVTVAGGSRWVIS